MSSDDEGILKASGLGPRSKSVSSPTSKLKKARLLQSEADLAEAELQLAPAKKVPAAPEGDETPPTESLGTRSRSVPSMSFPGKNRQGIEIKDDTPLENEWTIWFDKSSRKQQKGKPAMYEDCIMELGTFNTLADYKKYEICLKVQNLKDHCNLRVFRKGIKPLWEDNMNRHGGKWVVRGVPKANRENLWTAMITALITERLEDNSTDQVCGVVLSTRDNGDSMQLWKDGGDTSIPEPEADREARLARPPTDVMLKDLLFYDCDEPYTRFIYQTHSELQQPAAAPAAAVAKPDQGKADDFSLTSGSATATPHGSPPRQAQPSPPAQTQPKKEKKQKNKQAQQPAKGQDAARAMLTQQQQQQQQQQQNLVAGIMPGMLPGMLPLGGMPGMQMPNLAVGGLQGQNLFDVNNPNYAGMMQNMQQFSQQQPQPQAAAQAATTAAAAAAAASKPAAAAAPYVDPADTNWTYNDAGSPDDDDDDFDFCADGQEVNEPVRIIQERAKQIRTVRKKIRYINFFLTRQCKGRELTPAEKQKVKTLPFLQKELELLEDTQAKEVEQQKRMLGVESLEFLRKPQQPMTYSSESERRFKTMRSIRKKIRFIHYHLERQRQGKVLSPAETAKVQALPDFERRLLELEAEEAKANEAAGGAAAPAASAGGDAANPAFPGGNFGGDSSLLGSSLLAGNDFGASFSAPSGGANPVNAPAVPDAFFGGQKLDAQPAAGATPAAPAQGAAYANAAFMGGFQSMLQQPQSAAQGGVAGFGTGDAFGAAAGLTGLVGLPAQQPSPPGTKPQPPQLQTTGLQASPELTLQPPGAQALVNPSSIVELQAQIEAQRRELHEKQKHIDFLIRTQQGGALGLGGANAANLYLSPGPPPLDSPNTLLGAAGPMSPVGGLPPQNRLPLVADQNQQLYGSLMGSNVQAI